jgi:phosphoribosyl 1,2-cyclic phosphodiesterase
MNDFFSVAAILAIGWITLAYFVITRPSGSSSQPGPRRLYRAPLQSKMPPGFDITDVGQQLCAVMAAPFERRQLLNWSEYQTFKIVEADVAAMQQGFRVYPQTSLGEVLYSSDTNAFRSVNSKRVDMLIVNRAGWPIAAVEYQGTGHYQGTAAARDAVKKEALRKAGIRYVEISASLSANQIRSRVREELASQTGEQATYGDRKKA